MSFDVSLSGTMRNFQTTAEQEKTQTWSTKHPLQPPLRRRLRQAQRGRDLRLAHAMGCQPCVDGEEYLSETHHDAHNMLVNACV